MYKMPQLCMLLILMTGICAYPNDVQQNLRNCINKCYQSVQQQDCCVNQNNCNNCVKPQLNQGCTCPTNPSRLGCYCVQEPVIQPFRPVCNNCAINPQPEKKVTKPIIHQHEQKPDEPVIEQEINQDRVVKPIIETNTCCQPRPNYPISNYPFQNVPRQPCCQNSQMIQGCVICFSIPIRPPMQMPTSHCNPFCFGSAQCCNTWGNAQPYTY